MSWGKAIKDWWFSKDSNWELVGQGDPLGSYGPKWVLEAFRKVNRQQPDLVYRFTGESFFYKVVTGGQGGGYYAIYRKPKEDKVGVA